MATKKKEEPLFVNVPESKNLRVSILESSRNLLDALRKYENFKKTREQKKLLIEKIRVTLKEVAKLVTNVKSFLPTITIKEPVQKKIPEIKPIQTPVVIKPKKTEIQRLEAELNDIEAKIRSIA